MIVKFYGANLRKRIKQNNIYKLFGRARYVSDMNYSPNKLAVSML